MRTGGLCALGLGMGALALAAVPPPPAAPIDAPVALYQQKHYAAARALLEPLAAAQPDNSAAAFYLGMSLFKVGGTQALDSSRTWLGRATKLAPDNPTYLAEYAGVCLLLADRDHSLSLALEGRDAMTRAVAANPADLEAREGLMKFYAKAPWPLGDADRALAQAAEIARRNPERGRADYLAVAALFRTAGRAERAAQADRGAQRLSETLSP